MGKRVHVVKKQPEYGSTEAFNWKQEEFKNLLNALGADVHEGEEYSDDFECEKYKYERAIEILKRFEKDGKDANLTDLPICEFENGLYTEGEISDITEFVDLDDVEDCLIKLTYKDDYDDDNDDKDDEIIKDNIGKFIKVMEDFLEEADPNSSWISFSAW